MSYWDVQAQMPTAFYTYSTDAISFLFMFNSFLRLPIYYVCNRDMRGQFQKVADYFRSLKNVKENSADDVIML